MTTGKPTLAQKRTYVTSSLRKARAAGELGAIAADLRIPEYKLYDFAKIGSSTPDSATLIGNGQLQKIYNYLKKRGNDDASTHAKIR